METDQLILAFAIACFITAFVFAIAGLRRRLERGRPARHTLGIGLVDIIEGFSGRELSPKAQSRTFIIAIVVSIIVVAIVIATAVVIQYLGGGS